MIHLVLGYYNKFFPKNVVEISARLLIARFRDPLNVLGLIGRS